MMEKFDLEIADKYMAEREKLKDLLKTDEGMEWWFSLSEQEMHRHCILLPPQSYGKKVEQWYRNHLKLLPPTNKDGDFTTFNGARIEYKVCRRGTDNHGRWLQIRDHENLDYYIFTLVETDGRIIHFLLTGEEMKYELSQPYATLSHGRKNIVESNDKVEYSITLNKNVRNWWEQFERGIDYLETFAVCA